MASPSSRSWLLSQTAMIQLPQQHTALTTPRASQAANQLLLGSRSRGTYRQSPPGYVWWGRGGLVVSTPSNRTGSHSRFTVTWRLMVVGGLSYNAEWTDQWTFIGAGWITYEDLVI